MSQVVQAMPYNPPRKKRKVYRRHPYDRRSQLGRRITELAAMFRERLGSVGLDDPILSDQVERAAELVALSETVRARALDGDPNATLDDVVRLTRAADAAVKRLGLDRAKQPQGGNMQRYLAREYPEKEGA
jgi:hypothetical protein